MKRIALIIFMGGIICLMNAQHKNIKTIAIKAEHGYIIPIGSDAETLEINDVVDAEPDKNDAFYSVEEDPEFPGGKEALAKYLQDSLRYPAICKERGVQGRVIVQFVINPDSTINDIWVVRPVHPHLDKEAVRLVEAMPKWIPGKQRGIPVRVRFTLAVNFRLPKENP